MRYTTIIDIRECPALYKNLSIRLLYLHLCLTAGYHDNDRGRVLQSIRTLSEQCSVSVSAVRNALHALEKYGLIKRNKKGVLYVKTYCEEQTITKPKRKQQDIQNAKLSEEREQHNRQLEKEREEQRTNATPMPESLAKKFGIKH